LISFKITKNVSIKPVVGLIILKLMTLDCPADESR